MIMLLVAVSLNAQDVLHFQREEADQLLGRVGNTTAFTDNVMIELSDEMKVRWWIINPPHIFVPDRYDGSVTTAIVGVYAADGTLLARAEKWRGMPSETGQALIMDAKVKVESMKNKKKMAMTIYDILQNTKRHPGSYIRVVVPVYGGSLMDFSFKLPDQLYSKQ